MRRKLFSWHCFSHLPKITAPQHVIFSGKLSTIIIFKLCKFSVNLWTLCFMSYKSYIDPLNYGALIYSEATDNFLNVTHCVRLQSRPRNPSWVLPGWHCPCDNRSGHSWALQTLYWRTLDATVAHRVVYGPHSQGQAVRIKTVLNYLGMS